VIGRTGGEEFAVALAGVDTEAAVSIMEDIRVAFSKISHQHEKGEFTATLSCGIAIFPHFSDLSSLADAADRALYQAKAAGRNRVILADG
jgi:diguanylate cyclase (GGDEF)-like protein